MPPRRTPGLIVVAMAVAAVAAFLLPHSPSGLRGLLASVGPGAPLIALAAWVLLTPAMFPGGVLAAAGGLAFGAFGARYWHSAARSPAVLSPSPSPAPRRANPPSALWNASRGSAASTSYWSAVGLQPSSQHD